MTQRWYEQHRMDWIAECLRVYGFIQRRHIMIKFGLSMAQAAIDLRTFQRRYPGVVRYDTSAKRYESVRSETQSD